MPEHVRCVVPLRAGRPAVSRVPCLRRPWGDACRWRGVRGAAAKSLWSCSFPFVALRSWLPRGMKKAGCTCGAPGHACHARRPPKLPGKRNRSKKTPRWNGAPGILQEWRPGAGGTTRPRCVWHTGRKGPRKPKPVPGPRRRGPAPDEGGHWARRPWWAALRGGVRCWRSCGTCVRCRGPGHGVAMSSMGPRHPLRPGHVVRRGAWGGCGLFRERRCDIAKRHPAGWERE